MLTILCTYTDFVKSKLEQYPDTSCAQMHDWLKEYHLDFPGVAVKTVYNFVWWVRQRFNIPLPCIPRREYGVVPEQPAGKQGQLDFGEYNMHTADGKRVKAHFLVCQLCFSRAKYLYFQVFPFTTQTAITVHERSSIYLIILVLMNLQSPESKPKSTASLKISSANLFFEFLSLGISLPYFR